MKRLLPIMKVLILFLIVPNSLYAYDFESGGIYYGILNDGVNVSVTSGSTEYQGDIVIPSVVTYKDKSYNVTNISWDAFMGCHGLTSVKIPKSMRYIGDNAFLYCDNLTAVYISDLEAFMNISFSMGDYPSNPLFYAQHLYLNGVEIIDLVIPNQITRINSYAFINCSSLKSVTIPNSVTSIGTNAFLGCSGLTAIVSEIEKPFGLDGYVFSDDIYANAELIVPTGTKTAYQATEGWNKFTKIVEYEKRKTIHVATAGTLPDLIQNYEKNLIEELTLTGELNGTDLAFLREMAGRSRWIWFHFENANIFDLKSGEGLTLETQGKLINLDISNATIVSGGGPSLQLQGTGFTNIYSSDNTIPAGLFHDCRLTSIKLPQNVSIIESLAFGNCPLTSIIIPSSVEIIGRSAFWGCSSLESIVVENGNTKYDSRNNCEAIIETESNTLIAGCKNTIIPSNVTSIGNEAFEDCSGLTSVTIPNSVTSIGLSAFEGCSGLTSITIPSSVTSIGDWAFSVCIGLNSVTIPNSVTSIGRSAFSGCSGLTSVSIPNSVTSIGNGVFNSCSGLTSVTIPNSVTSIGDYAFYGCSGLTTIVSEIDKPFKIDNSVFNGILSDAQLIVPKGTKAAYQATEGWNKFTNITEATDIGKIIEVNGLYYEVTESGEAEVVSADNGVTNITIPSTVSHNNTSYKVTAIAKDAFEECEYLAAVIWEPEAQFNATVNNPNFLLYVNDEKYASRTIKNVVVKGIAESIELTDDANGNDFYCPRVFKTGNIIYKHNYQMETGIGDSRGWETIVLPFDVQKYTHATKGELESFTTWSKSSSKKPFWLFELTASGYKDVAGIKANTPYIISMPNNQQYEQQYQIPGVVTFSASNVEVQKTDNLKPVSYQG